MKPAPLITQQTRVNAKGVFLLKVRLKKGNENEGTFHPEVSNHDGA